jgi:hypothetical protein
VDTVFLFAIGGSITPSIPYFKSGPSCRAGQVIKKLARIW